MRFIAAILILLLAPIVWSQTKPQSPEQERLDELASIEAEVAPLPQIKSESVQQAVKFSIEDNMLNVRTSIARSDDPVRLFVPGLRGILRLKVFDSRNGLDAGRNFQLLQRDLTDPAIGQIYTLVSSAAGRVIISRDSEAGETTSSIQLIEDPPPMPGAQPDDPPVRLLVNRPAPAGKGDDLNLRFDGDSFVDLHLKFTRQVDHYLLPILRDYRQQAEVLRVDPMIAWQVLGADAKPDEQMIAKINAILPKLGADDFHERESAMADLKNLGQPAVMALMRWDRSKLSLQQNSAIDTLLADFSPLPQDLLRKLADDRAFLVDVLYDDDAALEKLASNRLSILQGKKIELNASIDRNVAIDQLRDEVNPTTQPTTMP